MRIMRKTRFLLLILSLLIMSSCDKGDISQIKSTEKTYSVSDDDEYEIIYPSTAPSVAKLSQKSGEIGLARSSGQISVDELCGYSHKIAGGRIGLPENIGMKVLDLEKIKALDYYSCVPVRKKDKESYSFAEMDNYISKSYLRKKITNGFSLNLGAFKLGMKNEITKIFNDSMALTSHTVYGELNLVYAENSYSILSTDGVLGIYSRKCLSSSFLRALHASTVMSILKDYGPFVITGYLSGGRASVYYAGNYEKEATSSSKEKVMDHDMGISFSWKEGAKDVGDSVTSGVTAKTFTKSEFELMGLRAKYTTYGGTGGVDPRFLGANLMDSVSIDLTDWWNSLSDVNTHAFIGITENGLCPLWDIVLEKNLKQRLRDTFEQLLPEGKADPSIEFVRVFMRYSSSGVPLYETAAVLSTRHEDKIVLSSVESQSATDEVLLQNSDKEFFRSKVFNELVPQKRKYFKDLEYRIFNERKYDPMLRSPLCIRLPNFDESRMYKYADAADEFEPGMRYIYDPVNKVALSFYYDEIDEDSVLDAYGIREWYDEIPSKKISTASLAKLYTIIAL